MSVRTSVLIQTCTLRHTQTLVGPVTLGGVRFGSESESLSQPICATLETGPSKSIEGEGTFTGVK